MQCMAVELQGSFQASFTLNLHDRMRAPHYLDESHTVTNRQTTIRQHPERQEVAGFFVRLFVQRVGFFVHLVF